MRHFITGPRQIRRSFLLMELLLSLTLLSVLLTSLGMWSHTIFFSHKKKEVTFQAFAEEQRAYHQLRSWFSTATSLSLSSQGLCSMMFDRGIYSDPDLAGKVSGTLVYDQQTHQLLLLIQSLRNPSKHERISLLKQVSAASCSCVNNERLILSLSLSQQNTLRHRVYQFSIGE